MRLWSLHPQLLDTKGLVAVWREGLLAKKVLEGKTRGYRRHPQLTRFKNYNDPILAINVYLSWVATEAVSRGYNFSITKINFKLVKNLIKVNEGQLTYEFKHLKNKLKIRDPQKHKALTASKKILVHPIFKVKVGDKEGWEKI